MRITRKNRWGLGVAGSIVLLVGLIAAADVAFAAPKGGTKSKSKAAKEEKPAAPLPWALRDHLIFPYGNTSFLIDVQTGLWRFEVEGAGAVLDGGTFEIQLADNSVVRAADLGQGTFTRDTYSEGPTRGTYWTTTFSAKNGLRIAWRLVSSVAHPFLRIEFSVENTGTAPIAIAALKPMVAPAGIACGFTPAAQTVPWRMQAHGACGVFSKQTPALLTLVEDTGKNFCLAMGILPGGKAVSGSDFAGTGATWQGAVTSSYDPPLTLAPGETLAADPVWLCYGMTPANATQFYALALRALPNGEASEEPIRSWVTVADDASPDALVAAAKDWAGAGVRHALVPGVGRWVKDAKQALQQIAGLNLAPGLTLDPYTIEKAAPAWSAASDDPERPWVNLNAPEARKAVAERVKQAVERGAGFLVLPPPAMPSEVLVQFKLTRAQAETLAFQVVREAAGGLPVFPASAATLGADLDAWLEAAACTSVMGANRAALGPVRLDAASVDTVSAELAAALTFVHAPIELLGAPRKALRDALGRAWAAANLRASPAGASAAAPRLWRTWSFDEQGENRRDAVVMLPGAPGWQAARIGFDADAPLVWRAADGTTVDTANGPLPPADRLSVYGVASKQTRPALLGASEGLGVLMDTVTHLKWTENGGNGCVLSGVFAGKNDADATAYVAVPAGWKLRSGKAGPAMLSRKDVGNPLTFPVSAGRPTPFELSFEQ